MRTIEGRKADHIDVVLKENVRHVHNHWQEVKLIHNALPEADLDEIDTRVEFLGSKLEHPLIVTAITGGYAQAERINRNLASACERLGIGMGVGSQRLALKNGKDPSYSVLSEYEIPLRIANIGAPQLIKQGELAPLGNEEANRAIEMIDGHCLAIHLNYLQEIVQPEGDNRSKGCLEAIRGLARDFSVIAKETGAGISTDVAVRLKGAGVAAIDVSGTSGTSFSAVEGHRAKRKGNTAGARLGGTFREWGIPSPVSLLWAQVGLPLIASGGIRTGLDVARSLVLGASCGGLAGPLIEAAMDSADRVTEELDAIIAELKATMFLTGCESVDQLANIKPVFIGMTREWLLSDNEVL